jgi:hypothetical protein
MVVTELSEEKPDIGRILIMLGALSKASDMIIQTLSEDRTAAATYRTEIRNEIASLRTRIEAMEQKHDREEGARSFAKSAGSLVGKFAQLILGAVGGSLAVVIERWLRGH